MTKKIDHHPLDMMSREFYFIDTRPIHPKLEIIGLKRVVSIILHESGAPEIGLADPQSDDKDDINYISLDRLQVTSAIPDPIPRYVTQKAAQ